MHESRNQHEIWTKPHRVFRLGNFRFDAERRELLDSGGRPVELRRQSSEVLAELARQPGRTVSKESLIDSVWGDVAVTDDSLIQCIADIRRTLGKGARDCIQTVPRRGYRLAPSETPAAAAVRRRPLLFALALLLLAIVGASLFLQLGPKPGGIPSPLPDGRPTLAVLPFTNMSGDADRDYFSDGLTEDLTTDLSRISGLRMISSASSFTYRDSSLPPDDIANELGATHFVTGSVRRDGRRIRINATLTEAKSGETIWADRYDRDIGGIFDLQDDVTSSITSALAVKLTRSEELLFAQQQRINTDAYDLLLRGLEPLRRFTDDGIEEARRYFQRAIDIDPDYARAHANLALTYGQSIVFRLGDTPDSLDLALQKAELAKALDPTLPQARFTLAVLHLSARNHDAAIEAARQAVRLDPSYADGYAVLAQTLGHGGDLEEALSAIRAAKVLSPRYTFAYLWVEGHILFQQRRYEEARVVLEEVIDRNPAFFVGHLTLAATYGHLGETDAAQWHVQEVLTMAPEFSAAEEGRSALYRDDADRDHYVRGLRLAGLPG